MNIEKFGVVPVDKIFTEQLLPLMKADEALRGVHKESLNDWAMSRGITMDAMQDEHDGWRLTTSDYYCTRADEKFYTSPVGKWWMEMANHIDDELLTEEQEAAYWESLDRMIAPCYPQPHELSYYVPRHSCHSIAPWAVCLAHAWDKGGDWQLLTSESHSVAVSTKRRMIFDVLLCDMSAEEIMKCVGTDYRVVSLEDLLWERMEQDEQQREEAA